MRRDAQAAALRAALRDRFPGGEHGSRSPESIPDAKDSRDEGFESLGSWTLFGRPASEVFRSSGRPLEPESLILAQNERWRHA